MEESRLEAIQQLRQVFYAAYGNFPAAAKVGDLAYATDRLVLYRWSGAAWEELTIHSSSGAAADIPAAADLPNGSLYFETDTLLLKQVQAGAWVTLTSPTAVIGTYTGNDTDNRQITTGFPCGLVVIGCSLTYAWICPSTTRAIRVKTDPEVIVTNTQALLHATDGFLVDQVEANQSIRTYVYAAVARQ